MEALQALKAMVLRGWCWTEPTFKVREWAEAHRVVSGLARPTVELSVDGGATVFLDEGAHASRTEVFRGEAEVSNQCGPLEVGVDGHWRGVVAVDVPPGVLGKVGVLDLEGCNADGGVRPRHSGCISIWGVAVHEGGNMGVGFQIRLNCFNDNRDILFGVSEREPLEGSNVFRECFDEGEGEDRDCLGRYHLDAH